MATHCSAWKIPWMEEPGGLQSMGLLRVRHNWATSLSLFTFMHWRRKWQPTPVFLPGESQGWWGLVGCCLWGRTESDTTEATQQQQQQQQHAPIIWYLMMQKCSWDQTSQPSPVKIKTSKQNRTCDAFYMYGMTSIMLLDFTCFICILRMNAWRTLV